MEINNTEELIDVLNFYFLRESQDIKEEDKKKIEKSIEESIINLKDAEQILIDIAKRELNKDDSWNDFEGSADKICFIINKLPQNKKMKIFENFFSKYHNRLDRISYRKLLFEMLEVIDDELKIRVLSKVKIDIILKFMSEFNREASSWSTSRKRKAYCKKYYEICKNAIEFRNAK